ncbi:MAG: hypothetical protein R3F39_20375 [Myxococcota bacterium]
MQKSVCRSGQLVSGTGTPAIRANDDTVHTLSAASAAVWFAADGVRDGAALLAELRTVEPQATLERLFSLLDELSETGILEGRLAPPADGLDRRGLFRRFAFGAAAAVVAAPVLAKAGDARAEVNAVCLDDMAFHVKEQQMKKGLDRVEKDLANEMQQKIKLDEKAAELKVKAEERDKGGKDTEGVEKKIAKEQEAKRDSYKEEAAHKGTRDRVQQSVKQEKHLKARSRQFRFGVGPSGVFVNLPDDQTFEGTLELSDIVMDENEKGCTLSFRLIDTGSSISVSGGNLEVFDNAMLKMQQSGGTIAVQWGTEGEFEAEGTPIGGGLEVLSTDAKTGKPLRLGRWTHVAVVHSNSKLDVY